MLSSRFVRRMLLLGSALLLITFLQLLPEWILQRARNAEHQVERTHQVLRASALLRVTLENAETGQRGYLLTGDKRYLATYRAALSNQGQAARDLRRLAGDDPQQQARIMRLDSLVDNRLSRLSAIVAVYETEGQRFALAAVASGDSRRLMDEIRDLLSDLDQQEYALLHLRTTLAEAQATRLTWILRTGGGLLVLLLAIGGTIGEFDIRKQQQVAATLKDSEERFRNLANAISQLCWMANPDGWIFWYNQRWYDFTGKTPAEMEGWGWQSVHDPAALPGVMASWEQAIAQDLAKPWEMVFPLRAADGTFHPFLTRVMPVRDEAGKLVRLFGTNTDITAQRQIEDALRVNQERLELAQQVARIGTFEWNLQTGVKQRTSELEAMYGLPLGGFAAHQTNWQELICPADREQTTQHVQQALETGHMEGEWRVIWPDGATHWLFCRASVLKDDAGKPLRMVGGIIDVTERKQAELEILRINAELETRVSQRTLQLEGVNRELEAFAYSVSHDLRAPLRGIDGWSLALLEDYGPQLDAGARQFLDRVRSETQRMGRLIDDMLLVSRVNRGELTLVPVDLTALANGIIAKFCEAQPERCMEFTVEPGLIAIGDSRLLEIALTNLLGNAVKFTGRRDQAAIEFGSLNQEGETSFYVRDNGVGFDMAYAKNLFGAFQRLHKASEFPGTGIGLATVQRVVRRHGGRVWAEGRVNGGATFGFTLGASL